MVGQAWTANSRHSPALLERMGLATGYDLEALLPTAAFLGAQLGHEVPALLPRAGPFPPAPVPEA